MTQTARLFIFKNLKKKHTYLFLMSFFCQGLGPPPNPPLLPFSLCFRAFGKLDI